MRLHCKTWDEYTNYCYVYVSVDADLKKHSQYYDSALCTKCTQQFDWITQVGLKIGAGTMCVTFVTFPKGLNLLRNVSLFSACVAYECGTQSIAFNIQPAGQSLVCKLLCTKSMFSCFFSQNFFYKQCPGEAL